MFYYSSIANNLYCRDSRKNGIIAFDAELDEEIMLFLNLLFESGDNPMICEICSHIGLRGNKFCPRCNAGGDKKTKMSNAGYDSLFYVSLPLHLRSLYLVKHFFYPLPQPSIPRNRDETRSEILFQFRKGLRGEDVGKYQMEKGVKDLAMTHWLQDEARRTVLGFLGIQLEHSPDFEIKDSKLLTYINPFFTLEGKLRYWHRLLDN